MRIRRIILIVAAAGLIGLLFYLYAGSTVPPGQQPLVRVSAENFAELREAFNAAKDSVRVVTLLSPT